MTEVRLRGDFHTWSPAGAKRLRSNYISLCLSTTHLSTRTRYVLLSFSPPPPPPPIAPRLLFAFVLRATPLALGSFTSPSLSAVDDWTRAKSNTIAR